MIEERELPEEELVRTAAEAPRLSAGLRHRVLGAARRKRRRRTLQRRVAWSACFLLSASAVGFYAPPGNPNDAGQEIVRHQADSDEPDLYRVVAAPAEMMEVVAMSGSIDWAHVESFVQIRQLHLQALRGQL